eukprot:1515066-Pleurochrysis_carterae.AAC.1
MESRVGEHARARDGGRVSGRVAAVRAAACKGARRRACFRPRCCRESSGGAAAPARRARAGRAGLAR